MRAIFSDVGFRNEFREALGTFDSARLFTGRWEWVIVAVAGQEKNRDLEGKSVLEIASERGADPVDLFFDLALEENFKTKFRDANTYGSNKTRSRNSCARNRSFFS